MSKHIWHNIKFAAILLLCGLSQSAFSADQPLTINHSDQFEVVNTPSGLTYYLIGNVVFETETGFIYCDSAIYRQGATAQLKGRVVIDEADYRLTADSISYNAKNRFARAWGDSVIIWTYQDSIFARGKEAEYDQNEEYLTMSNRPTIYFGYPDSATMLEVTADRIDHSSKTRIANADGNVVMKTGNVRTESGCATANLANNVLDFYEGPVAWRGKSRLSGGVISVELDNRAVKRIDVIDSAQGLFVEPIESNPALFDESKLRGHLMKLDFDSDQLSQVTCVGQAYSWYYPNPRGKRQQDENEVSGDTIYFLTELNRLKSMHVVGGAVGTYMSRALPDSADSSRVAKNDTVNYESSFIDYSLRDSLITLRKAAAVTSGKIGLESHKIELNTGTKIIKAWSAIVEGDSVTPHDALAQDIQPNAIPVILHDGDEKLYGDYLEYSIDTEKGRILQSKSSYNQGFYYGSRLVREQKKIFYVDDGRYTTCDADDPHFHFRSKSMKLMEGDKLIARPVVFYLGRMPLFAVPYYVFPLKRGRHSGILPLDFGSFHRGQRYIRNVGYYWAASDYFDWQGNLDYYERQRTITLSSRLNFVKRYIMSATVSASLTRDTRYDRTLAREYGSTRWIAGGSYRHNISPSFTLDASGQYQSDPQYFTDYSSNLEERLNRSVSSRINFTKKFGKSVAISGSGSHTINLDKKTRQDVMPSVNVSLPIIHPFGSGGKEVSGNATTAWYQGFTIRYNPTIRNISDKTTIFDTIGTVPVEIPSRRKYSRIDHNPSLTLPSITLLKWITVVPSFSYNESWSTIYRTDKSDSLGLEPDKLFRTHSYSAGAGASVSLYGMLRPNIAGLMAIRHVVTPRVTYAYTPELDNHPKVRAYTGAVGGSRKSSMFSFGLEQAIQAKVRHGEEEQTYDLVSINSSCSYNALADSMKFSSLTTTIVSQALRWVKLTSTLSHGLYKPNSSELRWQSPYLLSFGLRASSTISGSGFLFDERQTGQQDSDTTAAESRPRPWHLSLEYDYSESGQGRNFVKSTHFISASLNFSLTPTAIVSLGQRYNFLTGQTIHNSISIQKKIHCWSGFIYWVPTGSNRGFGFKLFVTDIPAIKVDNNYNSFIDQIGRR